MAAHNGHSQIVNHLIEVNAHVNMQNSSGLTALIQAFQNRHTDILKYLIEANANVNMQDSDGRTALLMTAHSGHTLKVYII